MNQARRSQILRRMQPLPFSMDSIGAKSRIYALSCCPSHCRK